MNKKDEKMLFSIPVEKMVSRLIRLESILTNGVAKHINMLDEYIEIYEALKEKGKRDNQHYIKLYKLMKDKGE